MKHLVACIFIFSIFFFTTIELFAQDNETLTRKEYRQKKKALKDTAREYYWNLERFEDLLNARSKYQEENDSLKQAYDDLLAELRRLQEIEDEARRLSIENNKLNEEVDALNKNQKTEIVSYPKPKPKPKLLNKVPNKGTYFTVQVGAYSYNNYSNISRQAKGQTVIVERANGLNKYLIGLFSNYSQASSLKRRLLNIGMPEAWIVAYKNGMRVPVSSVR